MPIRASTRTQHTLCQSFVEFNCEVEPPGQWSDGLRRSYVRAGDDSLDVCSRQRVGQTVRLGNTFWRERCVSLLAFSFAVSDDIKRFHRSKFGTQAGSTHGRAARAGLTPGIARPPEPLKVDEMIRVAGRVHAAVRCGAIL